MTQRQVMHIDGSRIHDRRSFESEFARKIGFGRVYGNADDEACNDAGARDELLVIHVHDYAGFKRRCPELAEALNECAASVNAYRIAHRTGPMLALAYDE